MQTSNLDTFAKSLVNKHMDPNVLINAKKWYRSFVGNHAVKMTDRELFEIYVELH